MCPPNHSEGANHQQTFERGFFSGAKNIIISDGIFNQINNTTYKTHGAFQLLQKHVAPSAMHDSKHRLDPPRCHPNTREAVLQDILNWVVGSTERTAWMVWLYGAAGAGKSAICQSLAEMCIARGILVASFFFFRTDDLRNTIDPLAATLAYQVIQLLPEAKEFILGAVESDPLIFERAFETQFKTLILEPLRRIPLPHPIWPLLLLIDGVDECNGWDVQMDMIRVIAKALLQRDLPLVVLFGSRSENQIKLAFNSLEIVGNLLPVPLDEDYYAEEDIRSFLEKSISEIKRAHPFGGRLRDDWPLKEHVEEVIQKSSGQFIYASSVVKFLSIPSVSPAIQLEIIRGLRPSGNMTPFAQLDALYRYIFSQVTDLSMALKILAYVIFRQLEFVMSAPNFFHITQDDIQSILSPLSPVLMCAMDHDYISFLHASLPDFLLDPARSREYCIKPLANTLAHIWFDNASAGVFASLSINTQNQAIINFLRHSEANESLREKVAQYHPSQTESVYHIKHFGSHYLTAIRRLDFGDNGAVYRHQLELIVRFVHQDYPDSLQLIKDNHEITDILAGINRDAAAPSTGMVIPASTSVPDPTRNGGRIKEVSRLSRIKAWMSRSNHTPK